MNASEVGMPAFTIAIGLVDGFNPCAMWVLLFLLSLLVNLNSRSKMFAIAGVFVLVSGLAYFAFMAAWLNVFVFLGYLRSVQITLGLIGIAVGGIHIKDFFAFKRGISLSIPESAKPGIYERTRRIVTAETMWAALAGRHRAGGARQRHRAAVHCGFACAPTPTFSCCKAILPPKTTPISACTMSRTCSTIV